MKDIAIFGAGGFGREVLMLISQINDNNLTWNVLGFYDDSFEKGSIVNGFPVLGGLSDLNEINNEIYVIYAIGNPTAKKKIISKVENDKIKYPVLIHPSAIIGDSEFVKINPGTIITAGCIVTVNINIGYHVILNLMCTVGHDTNIGDFSSFMPSVNISGEVEIEECVYVGTGAKIINQLVIGSNTIIGAGAVVSKSLPANCTAVGIPAKPIKFH